MHFTVYLVANVVANASGRQVRCETPVWEYHLVVYEREWGD